MNTERHTPRGIRNNNPGNLNFARQPGAVLEIVPPGEVARFAAFPTADAGLLALRNQLLLYNQRDHINTVAGVIQKWAPSRENNTPAYIQGVAHALGVRPNQALGNFTPTLLAGFMRAIIQIENGENPYGALVDQIAGVTAKQPCSGCADKS